ncbi:hypothetical protein ASPVEDRAFT_119589 [Aspergillus versicolor CBS 583.65]|uniref:Alpha/beta hydrolase fold-3 domain-containing protein n=1 Tax=Aspergillus versicolor CBS 583.65 TaxID=1036611 RepID=A0A1L9P567_ASPVE|nr:uncharacterized protein ASPVEDRAFT_119589 [Aspergillus versicolor CBS 583.65]OJI96636.1 hypothetical protein ASPVEDRAFT_119589 [Aspergillus versicolor CBS 583.65]
MPFLTSIRQKAHLIFITIKAKLLRAFILTYAHLRPHQKPSPDIIEYIPAKSNTTKTSKDRTRKIKTYIYLPPKKTPSSSSSPSSPPIPSPVLITACGSGFIIPGLGLDDPYCRTMALKTSHVIIDIDYRVAPENPFPSAINDVISVVNWVLAQPARFDKARISIGGFSAGGNIAASVAVNYFPPGTFGALVGFYPVVDASHNPGEKVPVIPVERWRDAMGKGKGKDGGGGSQTPKPPLGGMGSVPDGVMVFMRDCYLAGDVSEGRVKDPRVSPVYADVGRFPRRVCFVTCEYDVLAREAEELAETIKEGREVVVHRVKGCGHAFDKYCKPGSEREKAKDQAYEIVADFLRGDS